MVRAFQHNSMLERNSTNGAKDWPKRVMSARTSNFHEKRRAAAVEGDMVRALQRMR
jgi:hypothetical protein